MSVTDALRDAWKERFDDALWRDLPVAELLELGHFLDEMLEAVSREWVRRQMLGKGTK